jgi:hypothetical protein
MKEFGTVNKTMPLLPVPETERLRDMDKLQLSAAGAEPKVGFGVSRHGHPRTLRFSPGTTLR